MRHKIRLGEQAVKRSDQWNVRSWSLGAPSGAPNSALVSTISFPKGTNIFGFSEEGVGEEVKAIKRT